MDMRRLFYPESVAVIGASPHFGSGGKMPYYQILQMAGYKGRLYPVNPKYTDISGAKVFASLDDIPEPVDLAIAIVPASMALETVESAVRNQTKFLHFFTSGFSEIGNSKLERDMLDAAAKGVTRIIGPNCIGIHCTASGITCDLPAPFSNIGKVAFLGQSGGMSNNFMRIAQARKLGLNKVVSYGNQIDLRVEDYLEYLAEDDTVTAIAAYIEDIKDGRRFMEALDKTTKRKPVVILKGGITEQGAKAAASHTGAMATSNEIWTAAIRQSMALEAHNFEHMIDLLMMAISDNTPTGPRLGFLGAGGGTSVLFTDLASLSGLSLPILSDKVQGLINERIRNVNTCTANPVDLGYYGFDFNIMAHTIKAMASDEQLDAIVPYFSLDFITSFQADQIESGPHAIASVAKKIKIPIIPILSQFTDNVIEVEEVRIKMFSIFRDSGLAVYRTPQDAISSIKGFLKWRLQLQNRSGKE